VQYKLTYLLTLSLHITAMETENAIKMTTDDEKQSIMSKDIQRSDVKY